MNITGCVIALASLLTCGAAAAQDEDPRTRVAEIAALAEIAPTVCPDLEARPSTVMSWLGHAGLTQADLTDKYAEEARSIAESFIASVHDDRDSACSQIAQGLGESGLGLLGKKAD